MPVSNGQLVMCLNELYRQSVLRKAVEIFLISNFRSILDVVCFLLSNSSASELYIPTFRNTLFHLHRRIGVELLRCFKFHLRLTMITTTLHAEVIPFVPVHSAHFAHTGYS